MVGSDGFVVDRIPHYGHEGRTQLLPGNTVRRDASFHRTVAASLGFIRACRDLPHQVGEASGQVHCGWAAAEHGQDALQVEELQELVPAGHNTHIHMQAGYKSF